MRFLPVLTLALAFAACQETPVTHRDQLNLVPDSQMATLGADAYKDVLSKEKRSSRQDWYELVRRVGTRIAAASGAKEQWEFAVIDAPDTVNAFALPGGKIAVYSGLFKVVQNEAALAAVLGHEVGHVTARHSAERLSETMVLQLGLAAADLSLSDSKQHDTIMGLLGIGAQIGVMLPFSRLHESEADEIGLHYMATAGYDPREAPPLWDRMGAASGGEPPELLSTHPSSKSRKDTLQSLVSGVMQDYEKSEKQPSTQIDTSGL